MVYIPCNIHVKHTDPRFHALRTKRPVHRGLEARSPMVFCLEAQRRSIAAEASCKPARLLLQTCTSPSLVPAGLIPGNAADHE
eukprot:scaffold34818_cov14-Tisochrysis_lutea.AAC.1